jgi:hypothetical protein
MSCVRDLGSGNPAFAATHEAPNVAFRWSATDFDRGLEVVSSHTHIVFPIHERRDGLQISLFSLQTNSGTVAVPGGGTAHLDFSEEDVAFHYGRQMSSRLSAGIGMSPASEIQFRVTAPAGLPVMDIKAESDWGARLGFIYQQSPRQICGLVYDYYQETVEGAGLAFGGIARQAFHTDLLAIGASRVVTDKLLLAAEYQRGRTMAGTTRGSLSGWHVGAEFRATSRCAFRAGFNDKQLSLGVGYENDRWRVDYAFMNDWNDGIASHLLGESKTHQLQAVYRW